MLLNNTSHRAIIHRAEVCRKSVTYAIFYRKLFTKTLGMSNAILRILLGTRLIFKRMHNVPNNVFIFSFLDFLRSKKSGSIIKE